MFRKIKGSMTKSIAQLKKELKQISRRIYAVKNQVSRESNPDKKKHLEIELKQLQYQALFYIEK